MTELSTNAFIAAGQMLLDERERMFISACDSVCLITDASGWPSIRVLDPKMAALEIVNSQMLRLHLDQPLDEATKVALMLIRRSDGQHLIIHGYVASKASRFEEGSRTRISVASRAWSPAVEADIDLTLPHALNLSER